MMTCSIEAGEQSLTVTVTCAAGGQDGCCRTASADSVPSGPDFYGRAAPTKAEAYQPVSIGIFSTSSPVCGASMM